MSANLHDAVSASHSSRGCLLFEQSVTLINLTKMRAELMLLGRRYRVDASKRANAELMRYQFTLAATRRRHANGSSLKLIN